jgi:hypothetical protein
VKFKDVTITKKLGVLILEDCADFYNVLKNNVILALRDIFNEKNEVQAAKLYQLYVELVFVTREMKQFTLLASHCRPPPRKVPEFYSVNPELNHALEKAFGNGGLVKDNRSRTSTELMESVQVGDLADLKRGQSARLPQPIVEFAVKRAHEEPAKRTKEWTQGSKKDSLLSSAQLPIVLVSPTASAQPLIREAISPREDPEVLDSERIEECEIPEDKDDEKLHMQPKKYTKSEEVKGIEQSGEFKGQFKVLGVTPGTVMDD